MSEYKVTVSEVRSWRGEDDFERSETKEVFSLRANKVDLGMVFAACQSSHNYSQEQSRYQVIAEMEAANENQSNRANS